VSFVSFDVEIGIGAGEGSTMGSEISPVIQNGSVRISIIWMVGAINFAARSSGDLSKSIQRESSCFGWSFQSELDSNRNLQLGELF
jgi:hypothetical protein